jgi:hypothetical protein
VLLIKTKKTKGKTMKNIMKIAFVMLSSFALLSSANAGEVSVTGTAKATYKIESSDSLTGNNGAGKAIGIANELAFNAAGELDNGFTWKWQVESDPDAGATSPFQNDDSRLEVTTPYGVIAAYVSEGSLSAKYKSSQAVYTVGTDHGNTAGFLYGTNLSSYNNLQYHTPAGLLPYSIAFKAGYTPGGVASQEAASANASGTVNDDSAGFEEYQVTATPIEGLNIAASYGSKQTVRLVAQSVNNDYEQGAYNANYTYGAATIGYGKSYLAPTGAIVDYGTDAAITTDASSGVKYFENTMMGISYAVNDALSVSYESEQSNAEKRDLNINNVTYADVSVEMDITTIQAAYVMGGMTMSISLKDVENADYLKDKAKLNALCFKREQNVCVYQYLYTLSNDDDDDMW